MEGKKRNLTIRVYRIVNEDPMWQKSLRECLKEKLPDIDRAGTAKERCVKIGKAEDLISNFRNMPRFFFGELLRIADPDKLIDPSFLESHSTISYEKLDNNHSKNKACVQHFYFALNTQYLLIASKDADHAKILESYMNEFLKYERQNSVFRFNLHTKDVDNLTAGDIKRITFKSGCKDKTKQKKELPYKTTKSILKSLFDIFNMSPNFDKIIEDHFFDITLSVNFASGHMERKNANDFLSTVLTPMAEYDNIVIETKGGDKIQGDKLICQKTFEVKTSDKGIIEENDLVDICHQFLKELG